MAGSRGTGPCCQPFGRLRQKDSKFKACLGHGVPGKHEQPSKTLSQSAKYYIMQEKNDLNLILSGTTAEER